MFPENVTYEPHLDSWVCWDNSENTAEEVKRLHPSDTVLLFDKVKGTYSRYKIEMQIKKPIIQAGKLMYKEGETIEV